MIVPDFQWYPEVAAAKQAGRPIVALESTVIAHGLPRPDNLDTALRMEAAVREAGAVPATIAVIDGAICVGVDRVAIERLANDPEVIKVSRRDLAAAVMQRRTAATTVAATVAVAAQAGIPVVATGGIGGVHRRRSGEPPDISADLLELARQPVLVVCSGVKSILDVPATVEMLETLSIPVVGWQTDRMPAFYLPECEWPTACRLDTPIAAAQLWAVHRQLGGCGLLVMQPCPSEAAVDAAEFARWQEQAVAAADAAGIRGPAWTPFVLQRLAQLSGGQTLRANQALLIANARLAAWLAVAIAEGHEAARSIGSSPSPSAGQPE